MTRLTHHALFFLAIFLLLSPGAAPAAVVSFGTLSNQFNMEFVEIGSPGNDADTTGDPASAGAVPYVYNIGKFEVSRDMIAKANAEGGLGIPLHNMTPYGGNGADRPATGASWNEAARFVNWLNTSQGFSPAYKFAAQPGEGGYNVNDNIQLWTIIDPGYDPNNQFRNSQARYFLPSMDEWYKAAYYDPASDTYFNYPTGSNTLPTSVTSGVAAGTAVYDHDLSQGPADITQAGGLSPLGIMGMGGNVWEWEETTVDLLNDAPAMARGRRGGSWNDSFVTMNASIRNSFSPSAHDGAYGFRVASLAAVPEPGTVGLLAIGGALLMWAYRRRVTVHRPGSGTFFGR